VAPLPRASRPRDVLFVWAAGDRGGRFGPGETTTPTP